MGEWMGFIIRVIDPSDPLLIHQRALLFRFSRHMKEQDGTNEYSSTIMNVARQITNGEYNNGENIDPFHMLVALNGDLIAIN